MVYLEPGDYRFSATPTEVTLFDLSERIEGIEPLPGFVSFGRRVVDASVFLPLLGFEGTRLTFMLEQVQPQREEIYPIVGMPGFRPEYLFYTYQGNKVPLIQTKAWQNISFAAANCPFSVYHVIGAIDLSERIEGIEPLPGFVSFGRRVVDASVFLPLLGFEGTRLTFMLEQVQPQREEIYPIVGMPGFRPEYLFYTYQGNKVPLIQTKAWQNISFAAANCPFSVYHVIGAIAEGCRGKKIKIGLIGTKPHAVGGVLYHIDHPNDTELLHDFPVRSPDRTTGKSRVCLYDLSLLPVVGAQRGCR